MSDHVAANRRDFVRLFASGALGLGWCGPLRHLFVVESQAQRQSGASNLTTPLLSGVSHGFRLEI